MRSDRLRSLREKKGISQTEAAKRLGMARTTYSNYEAGNREPDNESLKKLAEFYEVSADYLLGRTNDPTPIEVKNENFDPEEHQFIKELREIAKEKGFELTDPEFINIVKAAFDFAKRISEDQRN